MTALDFNRGVWPRRKSNSSEVAWKAFERAVVEQTPSDPEKFWQAFVAGWNARCALEES